ncbi:MAG TPA: DUF3095 domain-containing protein [Chitinophagaceae bacterium]|jgi:hypothetical protein|nr:DUF3095 domain-containing protein [Chitinophagaceae bacterium]
MSAGSNDQFYTRLPVNQISLSELLTEAHLFFRIPDNWHVLITDVKGSTKAVADGLHETVNLVATGSIVAVLNIAYKANLTVPFFFGGDGATFIVPPALLDEVMKALLLHRKNTLQNFNLSLRVGHVSVENIYAHEHELRISKLKTAELFSIPVLLGNGLSYAERIIKGEDYLLEPPPPTQEELDLSGMQCRWDKIKPPGNYDEVVSLLVIAQQGVKQAEAFKKVIDQLDRIYGDTQKRKPITISKLKLKATLKKIGSEMRVRLGGYKPLYLIRNWLATLIGTLYFRTKKGKTYLAQLVDMSDTLVIDGKINTVISGSVKQREQLETALNEIEAAGLIRYGIFVSKESVMSCYVRSMDQNHIHFVDGSEGGYTKAAGVLKSKLFVS